MLSPLAYFNNLRGVTPHPFFVQNAIRGVHIFTSEHLNIFTSLPPDN